MKNPLLLFVGIICGNIFGDAAIYFLWQVYLAGEVFFKNSEMILLYFFAVIALLGWIFIVFSMETMYFTDSRRFDRTITLIKRKKEYKNLLDDFKNGEKLFAGDLIVGNKFLIGKGYGTILSYDDQGYLMWAVEEKASSTFSKKEINLTKAEQKQCALYASNRLLYYHIDYYSPPQSERNTGDD